MLCVSVFKLSDPYIVLDMSCIQKRTTVPRHNIISRPRATPLKFGYSNMCKTFAQPNAVTCYLLCLISKMYCKEGI
jgi:hypothetical protein